MQLHTVTGSPNGRKVEAVIAHLGLPVEIISHDFVHGLKTPDYLALNPNALVPTLIDGDFRLWESSAIMQYLADKAGDASLFPRDPQLRADVIRWLFWDQVHFNRAFGTLAFETVARPSLGLGPADEAAVARAQGDLDRFAPVLERHLTGRRYMVGDAITLADYAIITFESYRPKVAFDWSPYAAVNAHFDRMRMTEAWQRSVARNMPAAARAA